MGRGIIELCQRAGHFAAIQFVLMTFVFLVAAEPCSGRVITVDDDGGADFSTIQAAIDDADEGDVVEVQPGTYTGCLLYTSPSPRDQRGSRMPSSA